MAGISDIRHELCLGLALWNGEDPILKERMFGLTGPQGNHGEDVKEYWWYLEGLPSHALLQWRYHYPQAAFPYEQLVDHGRGLQDPELELLDTGVFDDDRYWSVDVTYAKASPTEVLARIVAREPRCRRGDAARCCRRCGSATRGRGATRPSARGSRATARRSWSPTTRSPATGSMRRPAPTGRCPRRCSARTRRTRLACSGRSATTPYPKDGINDHVVSGAATVNPDGFGTKAALRYRVTVPAGGKAELRLRLHRPDGAGKTATAELGRSLRSTRSSPHARRMPTSSTPRSRPPGLRRSRCGCCARPAPGWSGASRSTRTTCAAGSTATPASRRRPTPRRHGRNRDWRHLDAFDVLAMPDPWEYPWFAAWDLGFHAIPWAHLDPAFAKYQLLVLLREWFQHPNGALPAYEWNFDDVNPPVHVLAALRVFLIDGGRDREFLERVFQKLLVNFTWWLNREDADGNNVFSGGFLGLDNISPIDRSNLPGGRQLEQADGTAWMAYYALVDARDRDRARARRTTSTWTW